MINLILPPLVIVVGIAVLFWLFNKKRPELERVQSMDNQGNENQEKRERGMVSKIQKGVMHIFLLLIEKIGQWFKDLSLGIYRKLIHFTKWIKDKRSAHIKDTNQSGAPILSEEEERVGQTKSVESIQSQSSWRQNIRLQGEKIQSRIRRKKQVSNVTWETSEKPMISEEVVKPDEKFSPEDEEKEKYESILIERIALNPRDIEAYERLGDYYLDRKQYEDAKECLKQVIRLSPRSRGSKIKMRRIEKFLENKVRES